MKWYIKCNNLEEACKTIFRFSRMVCMFPLLDDCQFSPKFCIAPVIVFFGLSVHCVLWISEGALVSHQFDYVFHKYLHIFRKLSATASCILIVSQLVLKRQKLRLILNDLKVIDSELGILSKKPIMTLRPMKYLFNTFISIFLVFIQSLSPPATFWMAQHMDLVLLAVFINQLSAFCDLFKYSLEQISTFPCFKLNKYYTLRTRLYNILEDCTENVNDCYGIGMFFMITLFFITILHQLYQYFDKTIITVIDIVNIFITATGYLWLVLQLILPCNGVVSKANMFNNSLYNELIKDGCNDTPNLEEIYFHFEQAKEFQLTANKFFRVDKQLMCSMIITGTTYLVILLQYSD
ncbi:Gustatory receptor 121b [Halyomorpha halys]|nr:Gustatory receptor 121b [Halyomorpha halys]